MNLLERIEQVQYGRNEIFTGVKEKQGLRDKLNDEMEAFLKRGGKVKQIPTGYSSYRDGKVPMRGITRGPKEKFAYDPSIQETPNEVIEARNKQIRGGKVGEVNRGSGSAKPKKKVYISAQRSALVKDQVRILSQFLDGITPDQKVAFAVTCGLSKHSLENAASGHGPIGSDKWKFVLSIINAYETNNPSEHERKLKLRLKKEEAIAKGEKYFIGPCASHGDTKFIIKNDHRVRCCACRTEINRKVKQAKRKAQNESKANA